MYYNFLGNILTYQFNKVPKVLYLQVKWSGVKTRHSTTPFVDEMYDRLKGTLSDYEVIICRWPEYTLVLENVCQISHASNFYILIWYLLIVITLTSITTIHLEQIPRNLLFDLNDVSITGYCWCWEGDNRVSRQAVCRCTGSFEGKFGTKEVWPQICSETCQTICMLLYCPWWG